MRYNEYRWYLLGGNGELFGILKSEADEADERQGNKSPIEVLLVKMNISLNPTPQVPQVPHFITNDFY